MFDFIKNFFSVFKARHEQRRAEDNESVEESKAQEVVPVAASDVPVTKQVKKTTSKKQMFEKKEVAEPAVKKPRKPRTPKVKSE